MKLRILHEWKTTAFAMLQDLSRKQSAVGDELQPVEEAVFAWEGVPYPEHAPIYIMYLERDPKTHKHRLRQSWPEPVNTKQYGGVVIGPVEEARPDHRISPDNPHVKQWLSLYDEFIYWGDKMTELMRATDFGDKDIPIEVDAHGNIFHDQIERVFDNS